MTFVHPWLLLLLIAPIGWLGIAWEQSSRRLSLLLKCAAFSAICIAFAQPFLTFGQAKTGAVVLVDTSASITNEDLRRASELISGIERHEHGNWMKVVPFAARPSDVQPLDPSIPGRLIRTSGDAANATNFEAALTNSMSAIPSGRIPKLVLISDGNANEGSTARAIAELERLHVPVDTFPLAGRPGNGLRLLSVSMPKDAYTGEQIPIDVTLSSPANVHGAILVSAEGKELGSTPLDLSKGSDTYRVHARVKSTGATGIAGKIEAPGFGEAQFEQAVNLHRPKVLYLSQDPAGSDSNLLQALNDAEFESTRDASLLDHDLSGVQLVILNNLDLNSFADAEKERLEEYVKRGGGLLLIGGERQAYKENKKMDALDRALPAKLAPPKTPEGTSIALIIDKSSSMEGRKIELARLSAIGVVDHLKPTDSIGVLIFDNSYEWAVPMRRAEDKSLIKRLISGITPDGGTQIAPALSEAYRKVAVSKANFKHIVLLTDGISEEGDSIDLAREAVQHQVTISTVGLGQDVNRSYLEKVAATSNGRSYFLNDPQGLEQILLKDVQDYSGSTAVERAMKPIVEQKAEVLAGTGIESAPALKGYARFEAKPSAQTILAIDEEKKDPLYVRWDYGLGHAAVFASDAKSRWAENWIDWPGFDKFWINVTRDLLTGIEPSEATANFNPADGDILVTYRLSPTVPEPAQLPQIFVLGPNGFQKPIAVTRTAARTYHGRLHIGPLHGLFRIRPVMDSTAFPEVGLYEQQQEFQDYGSDESTLRQISAITGGRFNPPLSAVFDAGGRSIDTSLQLWPGLLAFAIALNLAELIARKWSGLRERFGNAK